MNTVKTNALESTRLVVDLELTFLSYLHIYCPVYKYVIVQTNLNHMEINSPNLHRTFMMDMHGGTISTTNIHTWTHLEDLWVRRPVGFPLVLLHILCLTVACYEMIQKFFSLSNFKLCEKIACNYKLYSANRYVFQRRN
jgi:hypothetical protein